MALHEEHEDFLCSNICYFDCLNKHLKYTTRRQKKTLILGQKVLWLPIPDTTCSVVLLLRNL
jgi:hypothetical protein